MNEQSKLKLFEKNKTIYRKVLLECKKEIPMYEMSYPQSVITYMNGNINYRATRNMCKQQIEVLSERIKKLKELEKLREK